MLNSDNINDMLKKAGKNPDDGEIKQRLLASLSPKDREKLNNMLNDRAELERLLSTPKAKELMKKFGKNG